MRLLPGAPLYDVTRPPFNVAGQNLAPDDTNGLAQAIVAANAAPGVVYLGHWHRVTAALPPLQNNNVVVTGRGPFNGGTVLQVDAPSGVSALQAVGCQYSGFQNLWVGGARPFTTGFGLRFQATYRCFARDVLVTALGGGTETDRSTLTEYTRVNLGDLYGPHGHYAHGGGGAHNHAVKYRDCLGGTNFPLGVVGVPRAWVTATSYAIGNVVLANGNYYQCAVAGLSAASGPGPNGVPGTAHNNVHTTLITDGSVGWRFAMPANAWYRQGSFSHTFEVLDCGALQGAMGLSVEDDVPASGSLPLFCRTQNLQIDHPVSRGMRMLAGGAHRHHMLFITSVMGGTGIEIGSGVHNWEFEGGEVYGCADAGITVGGSYGRIHGLDVGSISAAAVGTRDCIEVAPGTTDWTIGTCTLGTVHGSAARSRYGVSIGAGCDNYVVGLCRALGNLTGGILNTPGESATRVLSGNLGSVS